MRRSHLLSRNCGGEYPRDVIVMDTETVPEVQADLTTGHRLAFGWAMFARRQKGDTWSVPQWHRFETRNEFWRWALRKCRTGARLTIYCHNAEFDAQVVDAFGEMARRRWALKAACLQGPPTIIRWRRGRRSVVWMDTLNYWPLSLDELGKRVGVAKLTMPQDWIDREASDTYCKRDVEVVWASLLSWWSFLRGHDLGTCAPTLAAQSFNAFRHRFMKHEVMIDTNEAALALARSAYFGGRVECWQLGEVAGPVSLFDVNSLYPSVMRDLQAPTKLLTVRGRVPVAEVRRYAEKYALVADCEIATDVPCYPAQRDGRLIFPVGEWRVALNTPELIHALDHGRVVKVWRLAIYERAPLFTEFCEWFWATRRAAQVRGDEVESWQLRTLACGLYGKFGQRGRVWANVDTARDWSVRAFDSFDMDTGRWRNFRQIGRTVQRLEEDAESANSHPAISGHVTSAGRLRLWEYLSHAGRGNVYYMDTDSLMANAEGAARLTPYVDPGALGALKLEKTEDSAEVRGLKDYTMGSVKKVKGVSRKALWVDEDCAVTEQWTGWAGALRRGRLDLPRTVPVLKVMDRTYRKGKVTHTGRVEPLRLALGAGDG